MSDKNFEYAEPDNLRILVDEVGIQKVSELTGYTVNSLSQCVRGTRPTRKLIESFAKIYLENQQRNTSRERLFILYADPTTPQFKALQSVADAMDVKLTEL